MNERQEQTADVLGKLTVLGTIVLPMNIITGMWGMNVLVPGQDTENLYWFWSSKFRCLMIVGRQLLTDGYSHSLLGPIWVFMLLHCKAGLRHRIDGWVYWIDTWHDRASKTRLTDRIASYAVNEKGLGCCCYWDQNV